MAEIETFAARRTAGRKYLLRFARKKQAMSRVLALDWDVREARVLVGSVRAGSLTLEQAFSIPLGDDTLVDGQGLQAQGERLAAALAERGIGRVETRVAVGRASIELKNLTLPPAPDDDLPDLVRFQAQREFHSLAENWALDYLPLDEYSETSPRNVLAAAISPEHVDAILKACGKAGLQPSHLVVRGIEAAGLLSRRKPAAASAVRLLVDPLDDEVDLTVLEGERVVYLRSARLTTHEAEVYRPLLGEIRRTIAAVHHQLGETRVGTVCLCGRGPTQAELARRLGEELELPVELFDPLEGVQVSATAREGLASAGRFAPLVGLLSDIAESRPHALDFLHPRKRPAPPSRRKPLMKAAAIAGGVLLLIVGGMWYALASLDSQIAALTTKSTQLNKPVEKADAQLKSATEISKWADREVVWLEELRELSTDLPPAKDVMLTQIHVAPTGTGGNLEMESLVRTSSVVDELETKLRDNRHRIEGEGRNADSTRPEYAWRIRSTLVVAAPAFEPKPSASAKKPAAADAKTPANTDKSAKPADTSKSAKPAEPTSAAKPTDAKPGNAKAADPKSGDTDKAAKPEEKKAAGDAEKKPDAAAKPAVTGGQP